MLTIQPKVTNFNSSKLSPAFGQRPESRYQDIAEDADYVEVRNGDVNNDEEEEIKSTRAFWEEQKRQYEEAANDMALPKPVRKGAKIFSIVSNAAIDAIAVFCTGKMVIGGAQKAMKSEKVKNILTGGGVLSSGVRTVASGIATGAKFVGRAIADTDTYKATAKFLTTNKYAKPVTDGIKAVYDWTAKTSAGIQKRVSEITAKQYNNAISGTIATGAGVAGAIDETDKYLRAQKEQIEEAA